MLNILTNVMGPTLSQLSVLAIQGLIIAFLMNYVSGKLEVLACRIIGVRLYMILFGWLGTTVHELSHALMSIVFNHKITNIRFFNLNPNSGKTGHVLHRYNPGSTYQSIGNMFIGIAPLVMGSIVIFFSTKILMPEILPKILLPKTQGTIALGSNFFVVLWDSFNSLLFDMINFENFRKPKYYVFLYILFCIGSRMKLSRADLKGTFRGFIRLFILLVGINLILCFFLPSWESTLSVNMAFITKQAVFIYNIMMMIILMNVILIVPLLLFLKRIK